ncbi:hypothetical protein XBJ1_1879 [Xenorhabdus bovienii SS-2004]|uniref:Uncharacterized protein n=1 Tax=Xenorhabdus bovienii (strain SS-2004) TaxID=406818 RepID=D3V2P0_XENBS|nr:hypothetical protein XBJ1_1879 [Xenorhabdus bovienii SS-2004]
MRSKHHKENHVNTKHWMRVLKGLMLKSLYMNRRINVFFVLGPKTWAITFRLILS